MITMMMLLCYVNLSGMSLECTVIVLMNNSLLGGQTCTDSINIQQDGNRNLWHTPNGRLAIIPRLNFTCNGRITSIRARVSSSSRRGNLLFLQVWRPVSADAIYNKSGEVQLQSNQVTGSGTYQTANIMLTGDNTIEFQSGDVVGYYHPFNTSYLVRDINTTGYVQYRFDGSRVPNSVNLSNSNAMINFRQPLIQFTIGTEIISHSVASMFILCYYVIDIQCHNLSTPANGEIMSCSSGRVGVGYEGDTCSFTCNTGYELTGNDTARTCQSDGSWSGTDDVCRRGKNSCIINVTCLNYSVKHQFDVHR